MLGVFRLAAGVLLWMLSACMFFVVVSVFSVGFGCAARGTIRLCFCDVGGLLFWWVGLCCVLIHGCHPCLVSRHGVGASDLVVFVLMGYGVVWYCVFDVRIEVAVCLWGTLRLIRIGCGDWSL